MGRGKVGRWVQGWEEREWTKGGWTREGGLRGDR